MERGMSVNLIFKIAAVGILVTVISQVLKHSGRDEQAFLVSLLNNASAGEYAGFSLIAENATYLEVALITLVANARYLLMSCALSQRISPDTPQKHRFLLGYDLTDEIFGITIARPGYINPFYT